MDPGICQRLIEAAPTNLSRHIGKYLHAYYNSLGVPAIGNGRRAAAEEVNCRLRERVINREQENNKK